MKIVDTRAEQELLEAMIEGTKPMMPSECRHLNYLLSTPFRYDADYPKGSRFRRAGKTEGVFYAAEAAQTAVAEMAFFRLVFYAESPGTPWPGNPSDYTAFSAAVFTAAMVDLTVSPLDVAKQDWTDPISYQACQAMADTVRAAGGDVIRYESVRDPQRRANLAVLKSAALTQPNPIDLQTWRLLLNANGVQAFCENPRERIEFDRNTFAADPRIADLQWDRR